MLRAQIPLSTKLAVLSDIDKGETHKTIRNRYRLKNYSNINRIMNQRATLDQLNNSDVDSSDGGEQDNGITIVLAIKEQVEKLKLGVALLKTVSNTFSKNITETTVKIQSLEDTLEEMDENEEIQSADEDEDIEEGSEESDDDDNSENDDVQQTGMGSTTGINQSVMRKVVNLLLKIQILNNVGETLETSLSKVITDTTNFGRIIKGGDVESEMDIEEDEEED